MKAEKAAELEAFWRAHLEAWQASDLNQREYCERHGLPLKRFGNWRAKFKDEAAFRPIKVLWRRGGGLEHRLKHMPKEIPTTPASYIRGHNAERRRSVRDARSRSLVEAMKPWLERQLTRLPPRSTLAEAIRYALARWPALCRFLEDGRVELDTNTVERAIRPVTLGRKNHLFAGSDGGADRWAIVASLITTAKLNDVEPYAYLKDVLERLTNGHPMARIDEILPWNWKAQSGT